MGKEASQDPNRVIPIQDKTPATLPFTPCSNSLSQPPKPSNAGLHQRFPVDDSDRELMELPEKIKLTVEKSGPYSPDTGEKLRVDDVKHYDDELSCKKRRRLDDEVLLEPFSFSSALSLYSTIDLSFLHHTSIPESPSPSSHSLIESSKCTVRELGALPFTSLTVDQKVSFLVAVHVLRNAFPSHPKIDRLGRESNSWFADYISCCKAINRLKDKLLPFFQKVEDFETSRQKVAMVELELDKTFTQYGEKYDRAEEVEATTLNLRSQIEELQSQLMTKEAEEAEGVLSIGSPIEQLQGKLKSEEAEVVGLRNEADALIFKFGDLRDQQEVLASQHLCLKQYIDSMMLIGLRWCKDFNHAHERYVFLTEQWNSLCQLDLDSLAESPLRQPPARDELSDRVPNI